MRILNSLLSIILLFSTSLACYAGVQVGTTRIIYAEGKKEASVSLDNLDSTPYLIKSWIENNNNAGTHFLVTPPLFRLEGKQKNVVRIFKLDGVLPADRESLFFFNTTSIPASTTDADRNTLQIAVRTRLKLIFRPKGLSDDLPVNHAKELSWSKNGNQIIVKNPQLFTLISCLSR